jgi:branched-chain amino acid transport system ATP-binding protein
MNRHPEIAPGDVLLRVSRLAKAFAGLKAVDDLYFEVERGQILGLIGPNGSGKSTSIDCITGFARPDAGRVSLAGVDITGARPDRIARAGMVRTFQNVRTYDRLTLLENLEIARQECDGIGWLEAVCGSARLTLRDETARSRGIELLDLIGMQRYADAPAGILSYGQKKLLALAMTLISDPKLVILDEPLAGVNPTIIRLLSLLLDDLNRRGQTFLIIEHNVGFIMKHCHVVVVLEQGRKLAEGPASVIREDERVLRTYLGNADALAAELAFHA